MPRRKAQEPLFPEPPKARKRAPVDPDYKPLLAHYDAAYTLARGVRPMITPRTGKAVKDLLKLMPLADAKVTIDAAFRDSWFVANSGELYYIVSNANKYLYVAKRKQEADQSLIVAQRKPDYK